jgi:signal transduction histidine kinase
MNPAPSPLPLPIPDTNQLVLVETARTIQANVPWMMSGYVTCGWFAALLLHKDQVLWPTAVWLGSLTITGVLNAWLGMLAKRNRPLPRNAQRRLRTATRMSLFFGVQWAAGVFILWPTQQIELQMFLMFLTAGLSTGSLLSISVHLPAFFAYFLPCIGSLLVACLYVGGTLNYLIAAATASYLVACLHFVRTLSATFVNLMRSRFEVAALAENLKRQKELAEEANQSKSRFLAAASHDLRQPVHSLSLFVGALAEQPHSAEGQRLVSHLQTTVEALGNMFNALLNISKLDARTVQPEWATTDLRRLLQGICDAEEVVARDKGLALQLVAEPLWVLTDPGLLDRIVRNLVVNAVRYTDSGGVRVTARLRAGQVVLHVADSGRGIPADQQSAVFDEFVQLHNPERDRNQGLGLGLAIVRRLTALLGIGVRLRSRVGRGSVFTLTLGTSLPAPVGGASEATSMAMVVRRERPSARPSGHGDGKLVIVVDDDNAIREGMSSLLRSWGYAVVTADGLTELQPVLATRPQVPHLVVCDLRLRHGETGIETVEYLRTQYNDDLPAILITGDTDPERLRLAQNSGLLLLHKPVAPEALKAAMAQAVATPTDEGR